MAVTPRSGPIRVLVLNDFAVVTRGITAIFASRPDRFAVVALQGSSALGPAELASTDVVLFDPFASSRAMSDRMPEDAELGGTKWVVLTWNVTAASVAAALELGCDGYLSKTLDDRSLMSAVERINAGENVVAITTPWPRTDTAGDWPGKEAGLSPRESEVLCLIAQGFTNQEIAARAFIGNESLKSYVRSAYRKINVTRRSEAIIWCFRNGLGITGP